MAEESVFEFVAASLEQLSALDKLEARGTVRLALREAGLDARTVTLEQMRVVLARVLPGEMRARGAKDADAICEALSTRLEEFQPSASESRAESPEEVFRRLSKR